MGNSKLEFKLPKQNNIIDLDKLSDRELNDRIETDSDAREKIRNSRMPYRRTIANINDYLKERDPDEPLDNFMTELYGMYYRGTYMLDRDGFLEDLFEDVLRDIFQKVKSNIRKCENCGRLFIALKSDAKCCDFACPQHPKVSCKYYVNNMVEGSKAAALYKKMYMKNSVKAKRHGKGSDFETKFNRWKAEVDKIRDKRLKKEITDDEFILWLVKNDI